MGLLFPLMPFTPRNIPVATNPILIQNKDIDKYKTQSYIVIGLKYEEEPTFPSGRLFGFFCGSARSRCLCKWDSRFGFRDSRLCPLPIPPPFGEWAERLSCSPLPPESLIPLLPRFALSDPPEPPSSPRA